jgi:prepilin-type N-terminal cleavage/methylation domain-containing protein/prepilin-type processing-associated H-X9-DG protein
MLMTHNPSNIGVLRGSLARRGFTLIEILVVVSIIAILVAILIPALAAAKAESETVACLANQRTITQSLIMFAHQHNGYMVKGANNGYGVAGNLATSDGAYMGAPQVWGYGSSTASPAMNWDQVLVIDKYVTFGALQDPADTQDNVGTDNLRYAPAPIANAQPYNNLPGSYRLNSSNQPEDYQGAASPTTYESPIYNAYAMTAVPNPSQSIVVCDGGYAAGWQTTADVATWAAAGSSEALGYSKNPNGGTNNISNINTTIHSGKMNVGFLDGHCQTMLWADTWATAGQPVVVQGATAAPKTPFIAEQWRQIFSTDYVDQ